jgi:SAM-dependent methyltransferase
MHDGTADERDFAAARFWEQRLSDDYTLKGVGFRRLGLKYNRWMYAVRRHVFLDTVSSAGIDVPSAQVLDVGSGTGFYVDLWVELGAKRITGVDITETAVARLQERHPDLMFRRADVGEEISPLEPTTYDVVSAMDVLFHIVDDRRFANAIRNIHDALRPGGCFVWSDYFLRRREWRIRHQACRSLAEIERTLAETGFEIVTRRPMFFLMANPLDAGRVTRALWYAAAGLVSRSEKLGDLAGRKLLPVEIRKVSSKTEGPSTEIMVCRRRA